MRHSLTREQLASLMEVCSVVRLSELTGEPIPALIECYRRERGLKGLWKQRAWGEPDSRVDSAIDEGNLTVLQLGIVQRDVADVYHGVIARPSTAWQLYYLLEGDDPRKYAMPGYRQPDYLPLSGAQWQSIWGNVYRENPFGQERSGASRPPSQEEVDELRKWLSATIRRTALEGTGDHQSRDFDQGLIHGLTLVLHWLSEHGEGQASEEA